MVLRPSFRSTARKASFALLALIVLLYALFLALGGGVAIVEGYSMEPLLHSGDLVFILPPRAMGIDEGDIVVYEKGDRFIIHRVILKYHEGNTTCYVVKGDNNSYPDLGYPGICGPVRIEGYGVFYGVPEDYIVGVVVSLGGAPLKMPYLGGLRLLLNEILQS